jgi:alpha,alpha-trehalase
VKKKVPGEGLYLAGCHGLEIEGRGMSFVHPEADRKWQAVRAMAKALHQALADIPGALVEEKELSVAAHYRLVPRSRVLDVRERIRRTVADQKGSWKISRGKEVMDILPETGWTKGSCVTMLLTLFRAELPPGRAVLSFYFGDDLTDQDGFDALKSRGVSIAIGESQELRADYRLRDIDEVCSFLMRLDSALIGKLRP